MKLISLVLAGNLALLAVPSLAQAEPPVLGGVSAPSLMTAECSAIKYEPVPVYRYINGNRLGTLKLDKPELARVSQSSCDARPQVVLHMKGRAVPLPVATMAVGYDDFALSVFTTRIVEGVRWIRGKAGSQSFWMPVTAPQAYQALDEDLVHGVDNFEEVCTKPGECMTAPPSFLAKVKAAGEARKDTCFGNAYELIDKQRSADGMLYYHLELAESLRANHSLPHEVWVPAWSKKGQWTGYFEPKGC